MRTLKTLRSIRSCHSGFTLVEIMVAMGIGAVLMLAMAEMMTGMNKGQKNVALTMDYNSLISTISLTLLNDQACKTSLLGQPFNASGDQPVVMQPPGSPEIRTGAVVSGWLINSLSLANNALVATLGTDKQYLATLTLRAQKQNAATSVGAASKAPAAFAVYVLVDSSNRIKECYSKDGTAVQACTAQGGTYTPGATPLCQMPARSCPNGQVLTGLNSDGSLQCAVFPITCPCGTCWVKSSGHFGTGTANPSVCTHGTTDTAFPSTEICTPNGWTMLSAAGSTGCDTSS